MPTFTTKFELPLTIGVVQIPTWITGRFGAKAGVVDWIEVDTSNGDTIILERGDEIDTSRDGKERSALWLLAKASIESAHGEQIARTAEHSSGISADLIKLVSVAGELSRAEEAKRRKAWRDSPERQHKIAAMKAHNAALNQATRNYETELRDQWAKFSDSHPK